MTVDEELPRAVVSAAARQGGFVQVRARYLLDLLAELDVMRSRVGRFDRAIERYVEDPRVREFDTELLGGALSELVKVDT